MGKRGNGRWVITGTALHTVSATRFPLLQRTITGTSMAQENLRFLSMDQIESVRPLASRRSLTSDGSSKKIHIHSFTTTGSCRRLILILGPTLKNACPMTHDSYLIIPAFLAPDETDALLNRSRLLLEGFSLQDHPLVRA